MGRTSFERFEAKVKSIPELARQADREEAHQFYNAVYCRRRRAFNDGWEAACHACAWDSLPDRRRRKPSEGHDSRIYADAGEEISEGERTPDFLARCEAIRL